MFAGTTMHSHDYRDAEPFRGKNVLILGMGNSAMDISVECSYVANKVFLASRRAGAHHSQIPVGTTGRSMGDAGDSLVDLQKVFGSPAAVASRPWKTMGCPSPTTS